jgi:cysteine synthase
MGYTFIHPFDDIDVIAGQGTIGLELIDQMKDVEVVVVPIGGGGLISGVAFALKSLNPNIKVYGVQAAGAPSMKNSVEHKQADRYLAMLDSYYSFIEEFPESKYTKEINRYFKEAKDFIDKNKSSEQTENK